MIKDLLPVGSVVLLQGGIKKLVIMGIKQTSEDEPEKEYDYVGVLYPEGYLGGDTLFLFNHEDINDVIFEGYQNPERNDFIDTIESLFMENEEEAE